MIRQLCFLSLGVSLVGAPVRGQSAGRPSPPPRLDLSDSIRLERVPGGWGGPEYRILIDQRGRVAVSPDSARRAFGTPRRPDPRLFFELMAYASVTLFAELPDSIAQHPVFGRACGTDHPYAIVTIYHPAFVKRVVDYQGCRWVPAGLRELEDAIDQAAGRRRTTPTVAAREQSRIPVSADLAQLVGALKPETLFIVDGVPVDAATIGALRPEDVRDAMLLKVYDCNLPRACDGLVVTTRRQVRR